MSLNGQPVWFTVCPQDPNTPTLPPPCHYDKNHGNHTSMEQLFSKFKQKAWLFGSLSAASVVKHSTSLTNDLRALGLDTGGAGHVPGGRTGSADSSPRSLRKGKSAYGQEFLQTLKSEMERDGGTCACAHTINEAKLAKLHSILNVLRDDDAEDSGADSSPEQQQQQQRQHQRQSQLPEFLDIFESPHRVRGGSASIDYSTHNNNNSNGSSNSSKVKMRHPTIDGNGTGTKKRKKRSRALMNILRGNLADASSASSDSGEEPSSPTTLNEQSTTWLRSHKAGGGGGGGCGPGNDTRPRSDSFQAIPKLRESLNAGKRNRAVSTYDFDEQRRGGPAASGNRHHHHHRNRKAPQSGLVHTSDGAGFGAGHSSHGGERASITLTGPADSSSSSAACAGTRVSVGGHHYQMVVVEDDVDTPSPSPPPPHPPAHQDVEVSLHRINVTDVDKPADEEEEMARRSKSFDVRRRMPPSSRHRDGVDGGGGGCGRSGGEGEGPVTGKHLLTMRDKARSRSTGDVVSTDDEVLVVRTPVQSPSPGNSPAVDRKRTHFVRTSMPVGPTAAPPGKTHPPRPHSNEGEEFTSLDFTAVRAVANGTGTGGRKGREDFFRSSRQSCDLIRTSWEYNDQVGMVTGKSKSLDNLLEAAEPVLR